MPGYWVTIRGFATQTLHVEAESKREAREKAARAEFDDVVGYPDWERDANGDWHYWPSAEPVIEQD